jgi:hypothetical protein
MLPKFVLGLAEQHCTLCVNMISCLFSSFLYYHKGILAFWVNSCSCQQLMPQCYYKSLWDQRFIDIHKWISWSRSQNCVWSLARNDELCAKLQNLMLENVVKETGEELHHVTIKISAGADGGVAFESAHLRPSARFPIDTSKKCWRTSLQSPLNISPNPSEVISVVSEL